MKRVFLAVVVLIGISCVAQFAHALQFSADMMSVAGNRVVRGKTYVSDNASRMEISGIGTTIVRLDQKKAWVLMDGKKMYMEQGFDQMAASYAGKKPEVEVERKFLGNEIIDGRGAKKYLVVFENMGKRAEMYQWIDDSTSIPLKTSALNGDWSMEYKNIKVGPQSPDLFEIPAGYKKFAIPTMDDIKAMMRGAGAGE